MASPNKTMQSLRLTACLLTILCVLVTIGCGDDEELKQERIKIEEKLADIRTDVNSGHYTDALQKLQTLSGNPHLTELHDQQIESLMHLCAQAAISDIKRDDFELQEPFDSIPPAIDHRGQP